MILVHGLFLTGWEFVLFERRLRRLGYRTERFRYRSRKESPAQAAARLAAQMHAIDAPVVHAVGHSLGGLVLRHLYAAGPPPRAGRVVTLGTPHTGCRTAAILNRTRAGRWLLGASVRDGLCGELPPWPAGYTLGSIAGTLPLGLALLLGPPPGPSDGVVCVDETRMPGAADYFCLRVSHLALVLSAEAARQTAWFLEHGTFLHADRAY